MSAGVVIFFFGLRPTCRVPKNVGPRIFTLSWSSTIFFISAPRSLAKKAWRWLASRNRYADVRIDQAGSWFEMSCAAMLPSSRLLRWRATSSVPCLNSEPL